MTSAAASAPPSSWPNIIRFVAMVIVWGSSFLLIKLSLGGFSVPQVALLRVLLGVAVLGAIMLLSHRRLPRDRRLWGHMAVVAATQSSIPFFLTATAGQSLPSSLSSIYNAAAPTMTVALTPLLLRSERLTRVQVVGVLIGIVGVVVLVGPWRYLGAEGGPGDLSAQFVMLASATVYAFGLVYMRRFISVTDHDATTISFMQVVLAVIPLLIVLPAALGTAPDPDPVSLFAIIVLGTVGTGIAYLWNTRIVRDWGATRASTVTYVMPLVGVVLGVGLLGERIEWNEPVGGALILCGVLASQIRRRARPSGPS